MWETFSGGQIVVNFKQKNLHRIAEHFPCDVFIGRKEKNSTAAHQKLGYKLKKQKTKTQREFTVLIKIFLSVQNWNALSVQKISQRPIKHIIRHVKSRTSNQTHVDEREHNIICIKHRIELIKSHTSKQTSNHTQSSASNQTHQI